MSTTMEPSQMPTFDSHVDTTLLDEGPVHGHQDSPPASAVHLVPGSQLVLPSPDHLQGGEGNEPHSPIGIALAQDTIGHDTNLTGQDTNATSHDTIATPQDTRVTSQETIASPQETIASPQDTIITAPDTITTGQNTNVEPDVERHTTTEATILQAPQPTQIWSATDLLAQEFDVECLKPLFPTMGDAAWRGMKFNMKLCEDAWMKDNWARCRALCQCSSKRRTQGARHGGKNEVRKNFVILLWYQRSGLKVDWSTFDESNKGYGASRRVGGPSVNNGPTPSPVSVEEDNTPHAPPIQQPPRRKRARRATDGVRSTFEHGECSSPQPTQPDILQRAGLKIMPTHEVAELEGRVKALTESLRLAQDGMPSASRSEELVEMTAKYEVERAGKEAAIQHYHLWLKTFGQQVRGHANHPARMHLPDDLDLEGKTIAVLRNTVDVFDNLVLPNDWADVTLPEHAMQGHICVVCQLPLSVCPTMNLGMCRCTMHVHCLFDHLWSSDRCPHCQRTLTWAHKDYFGERSARAAIARASWDAHHEAQAMEEEQNGMYDETVEEALLPLMTEWRNRGGISAFEMMDLTDVRVEALRTLREELIAKALLLQDPRPEASRPRSRTRHNAMDAPDSFGDVVADVLKSLTDPFVNDPQQWRMFYQYADPTMSPDRRAERNLVQSQMELETVRREITVRPREIGTQESSFSQEVGRTTLQRALRDVASTHHGPRTRSTTNRDRGNRGTPINIGGDDDEDHGSGDSDPEYLPPQENAQHNSQDPTWMNVEGLPRPTQPRMNFDNNDWQYRQHREGGSIASRQTNHYGENYGTPNDRDGHHGRGYGVIGPSVVNVGSGGSYHGGIGPGDQNVDGGQGRYHAVRPVPYVAAGGGSYHGTMGPGVPNMMGGGGFQGNNLGVGPNMGGGARYHDGSGGGNAGGARYLDRSGVVGPNSGGVRNHTYIAPPGPSVRGTRNHTHTVAAPPGPPNTSGGGRSNRFEGGHGAPHVGGGQSNRGGPTTGQLPSSPAHGRGEGQARRPNP